MEPSSARHGDLSQTRRQGREWECAVDAFRPSATLSVDEASDFEFEPLLQLLALLSVRLCSAAASSSLRRGRKSEWRFFDLIIRRQSEKITFSKFYSSGQTNPMKTKALPA